MQCWGRLKKKVSNMNFFSRDWWIWRRKCHRPPLWISYPSPHRHTWAMVQPQHLHSWCHLSQNQDWRQHLLRQATFIILIIINNHTCRWLAHGLPVTASTCSPQLLTWGQAVRKGSVHLQPSLRLYLYRRPRVTLVFLQSLRPLPSQPQEVLSHVKNGICRHRTLGKTFKPKILPC